jgi:hypothetical protein
MIPDPAAGLATLHAAAGIDNQRLERRIEYLHNVHKLSAENLRSAEKTTDYLNMIDQARSMMDSPVKRAFDYATQERPQTIAAYEPKITAAEQLDQNYYYGRRFGHGLLLARRLVEAGARFIEVTTEYVPFLHWDTHENGHATTARMKSEIDRPVAALILDLEQRGLLDRTLVVLASEFSRDMIIEGIPGSAAQDQSLAKTDVLMEARHYGLHRHFTGASSVLMFGGGVKRGFLFGASAPERPCTAIENPVSITDLHATIFTAMGISPRTVFDVERRPFYATQDGAGQPVLELFS